MLFIVYNLAQSSRSQTVRAFTAINVRALIVHSFVVAFCERLADSAADYGFALVRPVLRRFIAAASDNGQNRPPAQIFHRDGGRGYRRACANRRATIGSLAPYLRHLASGADQCQLAATADLQIDLRDSR